MTQYDVIYDVTFHDIEYLTSESESAPSITYIPVDNEKEITIMKNFGTHRDRSE